MITWSWWAESSRAIGERFGRQSMASKAGELCRPRPLEQGAAECMRRAKLWWAWCGTLCGGCGRPIPRSSCRKHGAFNSTVPAGIAWATRSDAIPSDQEQLRVTALSRRGVARWTGEAMAVGSGWWRGWQGCKRRAYSGRSLVTCEADERHFIPSRPRQQRTKMYLVCIPSNQRRCHTVFSREHVNLLLQAAWPSSSRGWRRPR